MATQNPNPLPRGVNNELPLSIYIDGVGIVPIGAVSTITAADGQIYAVMGTKLTSPADSNGYPVFSLGTLIAGEDLTNNVLKVEQRFSYAAITSATTTTVKASAGFVHTISIVGGTLGAITVYDNSSASGTTILPTFMPTATLPAPTIVLDVSFAVGLTIVTAAATILVVSYR